MENLLSRSRRSLNAVSTVLRHQQSGQDMIEYALVAAIVAVGVIASVRSVQTAIVDATYNGISIVMSSF